MKSRKVYDVIVWLGMGLTLGLGLGTKIGQKYILVYNGQRER